MEAKIVQWIEGFVSGDIWRKPIVSFCSADEVEKLRKIVPNHAIPEELLKSARSVIVYFIPFTKDVVISNVNGLRPSRDWALAYVKTNELILNLNSYLAEKLENLGFKCYSVKPTHNFSEETLMSDWSHKHVAYLAGLGTFGHHTMLITEKGCCGRIGSLITTAEFNYNEPLKEEFCLYKRGEKCLKCVERCVFGALTKDGLDKRKCYDILLENDRYFADLPIADVCGKCACGVPCSLRKP